MNLSIAHLRFCALAYFAAHTPGGATKRDAVGVLAPFDHDRPRRLGPILVALCEKGDITPIGGDHFEITETGRRWLLAHGKYFYIPKGLAISTPQPAHQKAVAPTPAPSPAAVPTTREEKVRARTARVLDVLERAERPLQIVDIQRRTQGFSHYKVRLSLNRLMADGKVRQSGCDSRPVFTTTERRHEMRDNGLAPSRHHTRHRNDEVVRDKAAVLQVLRHSAVPLNFREIRGNLGWQTDRRARLKYALKTLVQEGELETWGRTSGLHYRLPKEAS